jgi:membrane-bound ClpP family serine protease
MGFLVAVIGVARLARIAHGRPGLAFLLTGALLLVAGNVLPSGVAFIAGMMILLRGAAVLLGVSEPRHRPGGQPARAADFFGFGTPPPDSAVDPGCAVD